MFKAFFRLQLHWQIIIGLALGLIYGLLAVTNGWIQFTMHWIAPLGNIFVSLLKLIAVPLVLGSLITGVASLSDLQKLSRIGGKTIAIYVGTTALAVTLGLVTVNVFEPGNSLPEEMRVNLQTTFQGDVAKREAAAAQAMDRGPLQPLEDMIPSNIIQAASGNGNMLQVVFFAIFLGIAVVQVGEQKTKSFMGFWSGLNDVIIRAVDNIMLLAPIGVFALIAKTITVLVNDMGGDDPVQAVIDLLLGLGSYSTVVVLGLVLQVFLVYLVILVLFTKIPIKRFFRALGPAQLLAFSTSSSAATLPVTMERCEQELGISDEVSSFVLPLGATINMDGTALYQAVAAVFIAQALGLGLDIGDQLTIILTAVLASIGTAAVPGAGIVMLVVILEAINVPSAGIALILGVDRILDMCRTVTNVTGDATVAAIVASSENQIQLPQEA